MLADKQELNPSSKLKMYDMSDTGMETNKWVQPKEPNILFYSIPQN